MFRFHLNVPAVRVGNHQICLTMGEEISGRVGNVPDPRLRQYRVAS
jgi:hypothetical protein